MMELQADSPLPGEEENSGVSSIWASTLQELKVRKGCSCLM